MSNKYFPKFRSINKIKDFTGEHDYYEKDDFVKQEKAPIARSIGIAISAIFVLVLISRLFLLQIQEGFINYKLAEGNRIRNYPIAAPRGLILDRNGEILASNDFAYDLVVQASSKKDIELVTDDIFNIIGINREEVEKIVEENSNRTGFVSIRERIDRDEALLLKSRLPAYGKFEVMPVFVRRYADSSLSHILGYIGKFNEDDSNQYPQYSINKYIGKTGIEKAYDRYLQGKPGMRRVEVDASGKVIRVLSTIDPEPGQTIYTTIDLELQKSISNSLKDVADQKEGRGAAVAMDPRDGSIRALVSYPFYNSEKMSEGLSQDEYKALINDENKPLLDRVTSGVYPSGSSIKPFIASSALEFGVIDENTAFETPPYIEVGQWQFPDWKDHGYTDVKRAIAESNNIFFYAIGGGWGPVSEGLGPKRIKEGLNKFGFGEKTGIDIGGEETGFIPTPDWKQDRMGEPWYIGNTYNLSIGQGDLLVTPIQLVDATCSIANGGKLYEPRSVSRATSSDKTLKDFTIEDNLRSESVMSSHNLDIVKQGMRMTVTEGSARSVFGEDYPISISGKTGTAQYGSEDKTHGWFTAFAPYDNPELAITVIVEGGGEGYETAAPVSKNAFNEYFKL